MRILITGQAGYIGPIMKSVLEGAGHKTVGLDTGYFDQCSMGPVDGPETRIQKDIRDLTAQDLAGFEAIVHLAALSNDPLGELNADWTYQINLEGSLHLARVARDAGVKRFLFSSSCSIYGTSSDEYATERSPLRPLSAYAVSKVKTEEGLEKLADGGFAPVFLRNATAFGVSPRMRLDLVVNNLTAWAFTSGRVQVMSDGTPWRPLVHIEDIARAFCAVLAAPREQIYCEAFNVGVSSENHRVRDIAEFVREVVPGSQISYSGQSSPDPRDYRVDFSKLRKAVPDFQPIWTVRKGVTELFTAFGENSLPADALQSRNYIRLRQLRYLLESGELDQGLRWTNAAAA